MPKNRTLIRLDQLLSNLGYCSRSQASYLVRDGRVSVEGVTELRASLKVDPVQVRLDGESLDHPEGLLILLHKPLGYVCSHSDSEGASIYELLPERWRARNPKLVTVGRLDKDTSGLLLVTDQHELVHKLTSPKKHVEKVYEVETNIEMGPDLIEKFASGQLKLHGEKTPCLPAKLEILSPTRSRIGVTEGRYHQVRRMYAAVGVHVTRLHRKSLGKIDLGDLESGLFQCLPVDFAIF